MKNGLFILVPIAAIGLAVLMLGVVMGDRLTVSQLNSNCLQYHKAMPLQDSEPLCKQILKGVR